jgi:hypothetical protein
MSEGGAVSQELIKQGRKFLHDVSNKLLVASGLGSNVLNALKNGAELDEKKLIKLEKAMKAVDQMIEMVKLHKSYLVEQDAKDKGEVLPTDLGLEAPASESAPIEGAGAVVTPPEEPNDPKNS